MSGFRHINVIEFHVPIGVTALTGDSGSGKTSLLSAICWIIFGAHGSGPHRAIKVQSTSGSATVGVVTVKFGPDFVVFGRASHGQRASVPQWIPTYAEQSLASGNLTSPIEFAYVNGVCMEYNSTRAKYFGTHVAFTSTTIVPQKLPALLLTNGKLSQTIENLFFPDTGTDSPTFYISALKELIHKNTGQIQILTGKYQTLERVSIEASNAEKQAANSMFECALAIRPEALEFSSASAFASASAPDPETFVMKIIDLLPSFTEHYNDAYADSAKQYAHISDIRVTVPTSASDTNGIAAMITLGSRAVAIQNVRIGTWHERSAAISQLESMLPDIAPLEDELSALRSDEFSLRSQICDYENGCGRTMSRLSPRNADLFRDLEEKIIFEKSMLFVAREQFRLFSARATNNIAHQSVDQADAELADCRELLAKHHKAAEILEVHGIGGGSGANMSEIRNSIFELERSSLRASEECDRAAVGNCRASELESIHTEYTITMNGLFTAANHRRAMELQALELSRKNRTQELEILRANFDETFRSERLERKAIADAEISSFVLAHRNFEEHLNTFHTLRMQQENARLEARKMERSMAIYTRDNFIQNETARRKMLLATATTAHDAALTELSNIQRRNNDAQTVYRTAMIKYFEECVDRDQYLQDGENAESVVVNIEAELSELSNVRDPELEFSTRCPSCNVSLFVYGRELRIAPQEGQRASAEKRAVLANYQQSLHRRSVLQQELAAQRQVISQSEFHMIRTISRPNEPSFEFEDDIRATCSRTFEELEIARAFMNAPFDMDSRIQSLANSVPTPRHSPHPSLRRTFVAVPFATAPYFFTCGMNVAEIVRSEFSAPYSPMYRPISRVSFLVGTISTPAPRPILNIQEIDWIFHLPPLSAVQQKIHHVEMSRNAMIAEIAYDAHLREHGCLEDIFTNSEGRTRIRETFLQQLRTLCGAIAEREKTLSLRTDEGRSLMSKIQAMRNSLGNCPNQLTELDKITTLLPLVLTYIKSWNSLSSARSAYMAVVDERALLIDNDRALTSALSTVTKARTTFIEQSLIDICAIVNHILSKLFDGHVRYNLTLDEKETLVASLNYGKRSDVSLSELSGGELDRYSIAVTAAFARVRGSPFIAFDETLSSLDPSRREGCISAVAEILVGRPIIFVCHDLPQGLIDNVVDISTCIKN